MGKESRQPKVLWCETCSGVKMENGGLWVRAGSEVGRAVERSIVALASLLKAQKCLICGGCRDS